MAITSVPIWNSVSCDMCLFIRLRIDITAVSGVEIRFKGEQLNQEDAEVCAHLFHVARVHPLGIIYEFAAHGFLKAIGRDTGGRSHDDLDRSIMRLQQPVKIKLSRYTFSGQL